MQGLILVAIIAVLGIIYAAYNFIVVKKKKEGNPQMIRTALAIRIGADTFLMKEWKVIFLTVGILTVVFGVFLSVSNAVAFVTGVFVSGLAGLIGMKSATYANVRVANEAHETKSIGKTLKVALRGGSVMGLLVSSLALLGLIMVLLLFKDQMKQAYEITNWCGLKFVPFVMTVSSYSLGCSIVAMFNRVGGGIFTKGADMAADNSKNEHKLDEDSINNPAVNADAVGDNVGDTAGLGSDILESYMGAIVSSIILSMLLFISYQTRGMDLSPELMFKLCMYPIYFCGYGLLSCMAGLVIVFLKKDGKNPHFELNLATWISAGVTAVLSFALTLYHFNGVSLGDLPFALGKLSPWVSALIGIVCGIIIGAVTEYYTSDERKPTRALSNVAKEGPALVITNGLGLGMKSTLLTVLVLGIGMMASIIIAGPLGAAYAAMGMLSFVTITVAVDTYGPISDNAGGIAEMCKLGKQTRIITDKLDSVGNTTAAIGKGFAIGSAMFAAVSLLISYLYSYTPINEDPILNLVEARTLIGLFIGGAIPFYFSGLLMGSVSKVAGLMEEEVRRQFKEIPGLLEGKEGVEADHRKCVEIATSGALSEMKKPALISILIPIASGFIFGPKFVAGILFGSILSAVMLAIFCGNAGGAWDNAKKIIEGLDLKGTVAHIAAVIGDMVGDPLKDTVGPSLDILIKIMCTVSLILVPIFSQYNLYDFLMSLF